MHKRRIPSRACIRPPPVYWRRSPFALALLSEAMTAAVATSARAWEAFWSFAFAHVNADADNLAVLAHGCSLAFVA